MPQPQYRVDNKSNVNYNGKKTSYSIFGYDPDHDAYIYTGKSFARGYSRTDEECIKHWIQNHEEYA